METERQLLEAIKGGDREALRRLYNRFSEYAMAISRRYIDERDDALDVVQDSFVSILTSIGSFKYRDEGSLKAWVSRIVANKAVDWIKHHKALVFHKEIAHRLGIKEKSSASQFSRAKRLLAEMINEYLNSQRI